MLRTVKAVQEPPQSHCAHQSWGWEGQCWPVWGRRHRKREHLQSETWQQRAGFGVVPQIFGTWLSGDLTMLLEPSAL